MSNKATWPNLYSASNATTTVMPLTKSSPWQSVGGNC